MSRITFYTNPMSRGQIARWALHEAGAAYDEIVLDYGSDMKSIEYLAVNPMGKVPAIVHEGNAVTEAAAICLYLADAFPEAGLLPEGRAEKALNAIRRLVAPQAQLLRDGRRQAP